MATVVQLAKDTRAGDLGKGVAGFLNRMADRRIDGLQRELMEGISNAENEAEAAALIADPRFQEVSTDNDRLGAIITHLNNTPLGIETIPGFDEHGSQQIISFKEGTDPAQALKDAGLTLEKSDLRFIVDEANPFSVPRNIGRFSNNTLAAESLDEELGVSEAVMGSEAMQLFMQNREVTQSSRVRDYRLTLQERQQNFDENKPLTTFAAIQRDVKEGRLTELEGQQAWEKVIFKAGLTPQDVATSTIEDLEIKGAELVAITETDIFLSELALSDPALLSIAGNIPRGLNALRVEIKAVGALLGIAEGTTIDAANFDSFSARSTAFRYMMLTHTLNIARFEGQEGRGLSEPDFDRFFRAAGGTIRDGEIFAANAKAQSELRQRIFRSNYRSLQGVEFPGAFPRFSSLTTDEANEAELRKIEKEAQLPPGTLTRQRGVN